MVLHLDEDEVKRLLTMDDCIQVLDDLFHQEARGEAENKPMTEFYVQGGGFLRMKAGIVDAAGAIGFKTYSGPGRRLVFVLDTKANLLGIVDAVHLTQVRTGAVSAVATRYMARPESASIGILGTGKEARTQLEALVRVRPITRIKAYSRDPEHRATFSAEMSKRLDVEVEPVESAEACVKDADIVVTATSTNTPILPADWIEDGMHICAVGATGMFRRELDENSIARASIVVVENLDQAKEELGDLAQAVQRGKLRWSHMHELRDVVSGLVPGRNAPEDVTLFDSIGVGTEDVAVAAHLLTKARAESAGTELDM
jgi:ornithine cyclodeaminase/alanine dehydrogenase-like protein (mu-crystallin family)